MALEFTTEETLISLPKARKLFPVDPAPSLPTLHRWRLHGVSGVKLECLRVGALYYTTKSAVERFLTVTTAIGNREEPPKVRTVPQRKRAIKNAEAELDAAGI